MNFHPPDLRELARKNPGRGLGWHAYAEAWLTFPLGKVLDYGCGSGVFASRVINRAEEYWGAEVDDDALAEAAKVPGLHPVRIQPDAPLPFDADAFDTVLILEVIEHVADERLVLGELLRVLKPGGLMLLTTPHKGLLTFLDPANFKVVAPRLHRWVYCTLLRRRAYYEARFGDERRRRTGLFGSLAAENPWHRHYRVRDLLKRRPPPPPRGGRPSCPSHTGFISRRCAPSGCLRESCAC